MARLRDVRTAVASVGLLAFARRVWHEVDDDNLFTWAAALAYSWLFAVFPFFIFLLALVPHLPDFAKARASEEIHVTIDELFPRQPADMLWRNIDGNIQNLLHQPQGRLPYLGLALALWAASGGMSMTMAALDRCYDVERGRTFVRHRLFALLLTVAVVALLLMVVCLLPVGTTLKNRLLSQGLVQSRSPELIVFDVARWTLSIILMLAVLAIVYHAGPCVTHRFYVLTPGTLFCISVWVVLGILFRVYVDHVGGIGYAKTYGTVGGVVILLLFFYLDALVLLIGAEINSEVDFEVLQIPRGTRDFCEVERRVRQEPPTSI